MGKKAKIFSKVLFLIFLLHPHTLTSQVFERIFDWNVDELNDSFSTYDVQQVGSQEDIFLLSFGQVSSDTEFDFHNHPKTERKLIWSLLDKYGEDKWEVETPCSHQFSQAMEPIYTEKSVRLYHNYDFQVSHCSTFYNDTIDGFVIPNGLEAQSSPGEYSHLYKTEIDLEQGTVLGDTLNVIMADYCGERLRNKLTFNIDKSDFLHFYGSNQVLEISSDLAVDSILFEGSNLTFILTVDSTTDTTPIEFLDQADCGTQQCYYFVMDVLSAQKQYLCVRDLLSNNSFIKKDIVKLDLEFNVVEEYAYPFAALTSPAIASSDPLLAMNDFAGHRIEKFGEKFLLYNDNTYNDELFLAVLDSSFNVESELLSPEGNGLYYFQFIAPLEKSGVILVGHIPADANNSSGFGAFGISIFSSELELLGHKSYQTWESFIALGGATDLGDGYFLAHGGYRDGPNNPNDEFRAYLLKENIANINSIPNGMEEAKLENEFSIFPNPVNSQLHVILRNFVDLEQFEILDSAGKTVLNGNLDFASSAIDVSLLPIGLYFLDLGNGKPERFVIAR